MNYSFYDFLTLLGALGLFLFGMKLMSEGLQKAAGNKMRNVLAAMTANRFTGVLTGLFITGVIQSSSATTVMVVSFVNAGLLNLVQAISVIMGANIGTTVTAWIVSFFGFKFSISSISIPLIGVAIPLIFSSDVKRKTWGEFIIGFALLFMGLDYLKDAVPDIKENPQILSFLQNYTQGGFGSVLLFVLIGTLLTVFVQSSSATVAITLIMVTMGWIPFQVAVAMVLGENIGTTITANLAAIPANISAKRAALSHTFFNLFGVFWMLLLFYPFVSLVTYIVELLGAGNPLKLSIDDPSYAVASSYALSLFHTMFNLTNTCIMIWFVKSLAKVVEIILPQKKNEETFRLEYIKGGITSTADISLLQAHKEIELYGQRIYKMFNMLKDLYKDNQANQDNALYKKILKYEDISDRMEVEIGKFLSQLDERGGLSGQAKDLVRDMLRMVTEIESVADSCRNMARTVIHRNEQKVVFTPDVEEYVHMMFSLVDDAFLQMQKYISDTENGDINISYNIEREINRLRNLLKEKNVEDINAKMYSYQQGILYMDFISESEKMADYIINTVEASAGSIKKHQ